MYEQFRDEVMAKLNNMDIDMVRTFIAAMDQVSTNYDIKRAETQIIVYGNDMPAMIQSYLVSRAIEGLSKNTVRNYQRTLMLFFKSLSKPINKITANDIRVWLFNYETKRNVSKHTMEQYRTTIAEFFSWCNAEGWLETNPMIMIKPIKYTAKPKKALSQLELEYIRGACVTKQELAIIELLYSTGCRVSELSNLKRQDIDWEKREVVLFGKGDKYRTGYINAKAFVALRKYLDSRTDDDEHLIVSSRAPHHMIGKGGFERIINKIVNRVGDRVGVHVTPHVFRHTMATIALSSGMEIQEVQKVLGHSNINTTMVYAHVDQNDVKMSHNKCVV